MSASNPTAYEELGAVLAERVRDYLRTPEAKRREDGLIVKWGVVLLCTGAAYAATLLAPDALSFAAACIALGGCLAVVGFTVQHDGNHGALNGRHRLNRLAGFSLDVMGASSLVWRRKHNVLHHGFTNVDDMDDDIDFGPLARFSPAQKRWPWHRWQHVYLFVAYAFLTVKWQFFDDVWAIARGRIGTFPLGVSRWRVALEVIVGRTAFAFLAFVIPIGSRGLAQGLWGYALVSAVWGFILSTVFQLAHCVPDTRFTPSAERPRTASARLENCLETTVNFATTSRVVTYLTGGLNHQIEHHLYPNVAHAHYREIGLIVRQACHELGVTYRERATVIAAIASHVDHLRTLGAPIEVRASQGAPAAS